MKSPLNSAELQSFLDEKYRQYNTSAFIEKDPVSIPHRFSGKEDREISGFLAATLAWGQRTTILNNMGKLLMMMDDAPFEFILRASEKDLQRFSVFVHRTFQGADCIYFARALQHCYVHLGGLEKIFAGHLRPADTDFSYAIHRFKEQFFSLPHLVRTRKHVADPLENASAKRLCMFLRWMVRKDAGGIDFGIWNHLGTQRLSCPLDVHSGRVARKLGLLKRNQNDWKAVTELTDNLKKLDPVDPVKYDYALFGLGVNEGF